MPVQTANSTIATPLPAGLLAALGAARLCNQPQELLGLVPDLSNGDYHADRTAVSSTGLKRLLQSPLHFKHALENPGKITPSKELGTAIHAAILEPAAFGRDYVVAPDVDLRTKAGKATMNQFHADNPGKKLLSADDWDIAVKIMGRLAKHDLARTLLDPMNGEAEQSIFWYDTQTGIKLKVRFDWLMLRDNIILDVKSTTDASRTEFMWTCKRYDYDLSAYMYQLGAKEVFGTDMEYVFLVAETEGPCDVAVYRAPDAMLASGEKKFRLALNRLARARQTDSWQGYQSGFEFEDLCWR